MRFLAAVFALVLKRKGSRLKVSVLFSRLFTIWPTAKERGKAQFV